MAPSIDCPASLFCSEDVSVDGWEEDTSVFADVDLVNDIRDIRFPSMDFPVRSEQAIAALIEKEGRHMPESDYLERYHTKSLDVGARQSVVSWLLKIQAYHNFGALSVALSVNYMDRFLSRHELPGNPWKLQLLAVACMSLAAKMEETEVPFLLDLQIGEVEHYFEARTVQRMELIVLSTLEWRMCAVTPFSYIDYYFHKLGIDNTVLRYLPERVMELILRTLKDVNFLAYRPSVIAAAAVLCTLDEIVPVQAGGYKNILCDIVVAKGSVERCCVLMQEVMMEVSPQRLLGKRKTYNDSSAPQSPVGVLEAATFSSSGSVPGSCEASPSSSSGATVAAPKRPRLEALCSSLFTSESL